jgi:TPR repeat protein
MKSSNCKGWCAYAIGVSLKEDLTLALKWLTKSKKYGNTLAAQHLADIYRTGKGMVGKDEKTAFELMKWSAEQSLLPFHTLASHSKWISSAPFQLAIWSYHGICTPKDWVMALQWFTIALDQPNGDGASEYYIGSIYQNGGNGIEKDEKVALRWYLKGAERSSADAQHNVARCYENGIGVVKNDKLPLEWILRPTQQNSAFALRSGYYPAQEWLMKASLLSLNGKVDTLIGLAYSTANGGDKDGKEAVVKWYLKGARRSSASALLIHLAKCYENGIGIGKDEQLVLDWMLRSVERSYNDAMFYVCRYHDDDKEVTFQKMEVLRWLKKLSQAHNCTGDADTLIGLAYENGNGVEKDQNEALRWYFKGAQRGNAAAQLNLAMCYRYGIEKNEQLSFEWTLRSAHQDNSKALYWIGLYYRDGIGTPPNYSKYVEWFKKATLHPDPETIPKTEGCRQCSCPVPNLIEGIFESVGDGSSARPPTMETTIKSNEMRAVHFEFGERLGHRSLGDAPNSPHHGHSRKDICASIKYDGTNAAVYVARLRQPHIGQINHNRGSGQRNSYEKYPLVVKCIIHYDRANQTTTTLMVRITFIPL